MTRAAASEDTTGRASSEWPRHGVSFGEALRTWARVGLLSFGGPAAQIAVMHRVVVDGKQLIRAHSLLSSGVFCINRTMGRGCADGTVRFVAIQKIGDRSSRLCLTHHTKGGTLRPICR